MRRLALSLFPLYLLALALLLLYYQKFHVWKKEGVSVGFVYDTNSEVKNFTFLHGSSIFISILVQVDATPWQREFVGSWTSHTTKDIKDHLLASPSDVSISRNPPHTTSRLVSTCK